TSSNKRESDRENPNGARGACEHRRTCVSARHRGTTSTKAAPTAKPTTHRLFTHTPHPSPTHPRPSHQTSTVRVCLSLHGFQQNSAPKELCSWGPCLLWGYSRAEGRTKITVAKKATNVLRATAVESLAIWVQVSQGKRW